MAKAPQAIALRAYARRRKCGLAAVQKAIESGRLSRSLRRTPKGKVTGIFSKLADEEWSANTDPAFAPQAAMPSGFQEARARKESTLAETAEVKLKKLRGELVDAGDLERRLVDVFTRCRTKLLAIPSRVKQQIPHLTPADVGVVELLVREALEDLAAEGVIEVKA